ncbi:MAG TPA: MFS transporter, partial [Phycisphaerales bacterium]|nr:MFS transporter [Phycisphaerales bacterium]
WMEGVGVRWVMTDRAKKPEWVDADLPSVNLMLGYLAAALLVPMFVFGIPGGVVADRVNRKKLLLLTQFLMMMIAASLLTASVLDKASPTFLLVLSALQGTVMAFNIPAWQVLYPRLVPRDELPRAINLNSLQFNLARVIGPALGGFLLAYSTSLLFAVNTLSFVGVMAAVAFTPDAPAPKRETRHPFHEAMDALRFVFRRKGPRRVLWGLVVYGFCANPVLQMMPLFITDVYNREAGAYGILLSTMGVGAVIGGLAMRLVPAWYPRHHLIPLSVFLGGLSIVLFAAFPSFQLGAAFMFFVGWFWLWSFSIGFTALQLLVADEMRGRVLAVSNTLVFGAMSLGSVAAGAIGDFVHHFNGIANPQALGVQLGVGIMALILTAAGFVMLTWRTPEIDDLKPGDPGFESAPGFWRGITGAAHRPAPTGRPEPPMHEPPSVG